MQYFIVKAVNKENSEVFWTGKKWVGDEKMSKKYKSRRIAESMSERLKLSGIHGERGFSRMEVLEKLEVL